MPANKRDNRGHGPLLHLHNHLHNHERGLQRNVTSNCISLFAPLPSLRLTVT